MRRRALLQSSVMGGGGIGSLAKPLSVVFANKNDESLVIVENDKWSTSAYPPEVFEPIGIVVIPGEHGVLKDGTGSVNQCGVISIKPMSYSTPETGETSEVRMYWGGYGTDISGKSDSLGRTDSVSNGLLNYNAFACDTSGSNKSTKLSKNATAYLPRQGVTNGTPTWHSNAFSYGYVPSPYANTDLKSGAYNEYYGTTRFDTTSNFNMLADFKGIVNTKIITDLATGESWKTLLSLSNNDGAGYYPAACCCARYHTLGTKAFADCTTEELRNGTGFWYLPACGELGYIIPRLYDINDTISKIESAYGVGVTLSTSSIFWSSSEHSSNNADSVPTNYGNVGYNGKKLGYMVRAFLRL